MSVIEEILQRRQQVFEYWEDAALLVKKTLQAVGRLPVSDRLEQMTKMNHLLAKRHMMKRSAARERDGERR